MFTSKIKYLGGLRTQATHLKSGATILTDAPVDNHGKGESFSPTDIVATALGSCMLTIMGIAADTHQIDITGTEVSILKTMGENPRRIVKVDVVIDFPAGNFTEKEKQLLQRAALHCPVAKSLHPDIEQAVIFNYQM